MKFLSFLFLFFYSDLTLSSQELVHVTLEELQKTHSDIEPDASAEYIYRKAKYTIELSPSGYFYLRVQIENKIKIYSKEGYKYANFQLRVPAKKNRTESYYNEAITYNLVDGKIEASPLEKADEVYEDKHDESETLNIMMPNVKEGSVIVFNYEYINYNLYSLPKWFFQYQIPIQNSELILKIPEYYRYNIHSLPHENLRFEDKFITNPLGFSELETTYRLINAPSIKEEAYVSNISNYVPSVKYQLSISRNRFTGEFTNFEEKWDDVAKRIYERDNFPEQLNEKNYFQKDLKKFIAENTDKYDVTEAVFNFVKQRMNWNEYVGAFTQLGLKEAYKQKIGNCGDINLMLVAMLRSQGMKAYPVISSTRSNGIGYFPHVSAYNYVLAAVQTPKGIFLYDATSKNASAQIIPIRTINWFGRIIYENGWSDQVDMKPVQMSKQITNGMFEMDLNGSISGKYRSQNTDYYAFLYRENYGALSSEAHIERLEKELNNVNIQQFSIQNMKDVYEPLIEEISFSKPNGADIIAGKIYLNPTLMFGVQNNPFKSEKRDFPIDFVFPNEQKMMFTFKIPEGYEIEFLPKSLVLEFQDQMLSFKYQISAVNNSIQLSQTLQFNQAVIPAEYYSEVKNFFSKMVEKNNEKVVLKKI
jgi:hypothetical protein